jgi:ketosteroid isomerase-like protein
MGTRRAILDRRMSHENLNLVRRMQEAFLGAEPELALAFLDPDVVYDARGRPDGKLWHGHDGVRRAFTEWSDVWDEWEIATEGYLEAGNDKVLILWRERGRGKGSGIPLEQSGANLVTVGAGRIVHIRMYVNRQEALEAAGIQESAL